MRCVRLQRRPSPGQRPRVKFRTFKATGLRPGVGLEDSASLLDTMES
jgi:hypothetical protein